MLWGYLLADFSLVMEGVRRGEVAPTLVVQH
jgi:hypothetical protein